MSSNSTAERGVVHEACQEMLLNELIRRTLQDDSMLAKNVAALEKVGFRTGLRLVESVARERGRFQNDLDIIKFLCREFWLSIFEKKVDQLKTNNKGIYVLIDQEHTYLRRFTLVDVPNMPVYTAFTCGIVRGALSGLGLRHCTVTASVTEPPTCQLTIKAGAAAATS